jgi:glucose/arabinose dehydrogenase
MTSPELRRGCAVLAALSLAACAEHAKLPIEAGYGARPQIPAADPPLVPTVLIAPAKGWPDGAKPVTPPGFSVEAFVTGLDHPRWLHVLPNGDVLVAETNEPARPEDAKGVTGWLMNFFRGRSGATVPSPNRITLLRDRDGDGRAETRTTFVAGLNSPFGMALVGNDFYVADTDALLRLHYDTDATELTGAPEKVVDLPAGPINHHWTKNVVASRNGSHLYVTVGSNSNAGENGIAAEQTRARILEVDPHAKTARVFATGMRNPVGLDWQPDSGELWVAVNERDELGSDLVPDYMTSVRDGGFYGFPYSYFGSHVDARVKPQRPELVASAIVPDYALGNHTASLGLAFYDADLFPPRYRGGAIIGQHGSWNRRPPSGYKVVFVPFRDGVPAGAPEDLLTGFLDADGNARGRPVGVAVDRRGAVLVADDVGNVIWRVTPTPRVASGAAARP